MGVIDLKIVTQTGFKVGRNRSCPFQKTPRKTLNHNSTWLSRSMFGRKVEHMLMARIAQERPPLHRGAGLGNTGHLAPLGDQTTDREAPVGIEIIHHPVVTCIWELLDDVGQMRGEVLTGACRPDSRRLVPWRRRTRRSRPVPHDGCTRARVSRLGAMGCVGYLRCRICMRFFIGANDHPCAKKRRALRYKEQICCALASKLGRGC